MMTANTPIDRFQDIRPFLDHEVETTIAHLVENPSFKTAITRFIKDKKKAHNLINKAKQCQTINEFKQNITYRIAWDIAKKTAFSLSLSGRSRLGNNSPSTFISNHRDIILDSAFLSILLADAQCDLPRIAIGDNLVSQKWIECLVKLNDSFLVRRNLPIRQLAEATTTLSDYIHYTIGQDKLSVWIAQREGRAKDSDDTTQPAVLKMLTRGGNESLSPVQKLRLLNIVPTSISYEYDPCDWLKTHELLHKKLNDGKYTKAVHEDEFNMLQGILGQKGRVHITLGTPLNQLLPNNIEQLSPSEVYPQIAKLIDKEIHRHYRLYPGNYIAWDWLHNNPRHQTTHYSFEEKKSFEKYIQQRVAMALSFNPSQPKTDIAKEFLGENLIKHPYYPTVLSIILGMYAQPAINHSIALKSV